MNRNIEDAARALNAAMNNQAVTRPDEAADLRPVAMLSPGTEIVVRAVVVRHLCEDEAAEIAIVTDFTGSVIGHLPADAYVEAVSY